MTTTYISPPTITKVKHVLTNNGLDSLEPSNSNGKISVRIPCSFDHKADKEYRIEVVDFWKETLNTYFVIEPFPGIRKENMTKKFFITGVRSRQR